jgi:hypothetical protein
VGTYRNQGAGAVRALTLDRGRFIAEVAGRRSPERGLALASRAISLPFTFHLFAAGERWRATVEAYDRVLHVERNGASFALVADGIVGPDETLCDATGGRWTDDDPDPTTGLYCVCSGGRSYIPSAGGCVERAGK